LEVYLEKKHKLAIGVIAVLVILAAFLFWPKGKESLVIVNGVEYKLLSYGKAEPQLNDGTSMDAYVLTVTYEDPAKGLTRGTIMVPSTGIFTDRTLPTNTVVWDEPIQLEGKYYAMARWNPGFMVPARERPPLVPEDPLTTRQ
jgi:hypothetical protein